MKFDTAFERLIFHEGGYVNDPNDTGGETYMGISRKFHQEWQGWTIIDNYKNQIQYDESKANQKFLNDMLKRDTHLTELVRDFYKKEYWDKFRGDELPYSIAEELLEQAVLLGTWKTAGINLQKSLNLLSKNGELFEDLKVDGFVGQKTLNALDKVLKNIRNGEKKILKLLNYFELDRFIKSVEKRKINKIYLAGGWLERV